MNNNDFMKANNLTVTNLKARNLTANTINTNTINTKTLLGNSKLTSVQDLLTYSAALLSALAFLWSAFRLYKTKKPQKIDIDIYILFFVSQILWIANAMINKDYLLLIFYTINVCIYFYIFFYYSHNRCQ